MWSWCHTVLNFCWCAECCDCCTAFLVVSWRLCFDFLLWFCCIRNYHSRSHHSSGRKLDNGFSFFFQSCNKWIIDKVGTLHTNLIALTWPTCKIISPSISTGHICPLQVEKHAFLHASKVQGPFFFINNVTNQTHCFWLDKIITLLNVFESFYLVCFDNWAKTWVPSYFCEYCTPVVCVLGSVKPPL